MLVSTLLLILIGFMLIVLFSMIPVVWRIRADNSGQDGDYGQKAPDFDDGPSEAEGLSQTRPNSMNSSPDSIPQPDADPAV